MCISHHNNYECCEWLCLNAAHTSETPYLSLTACVLGSHIRQYAKEKGELQQNRVSCLLRKIPRLLDTYGKIDVE